MRPVQHPADSLEPSVSCLSGTEPGGIYHRSRRPDPIQLGSWKGIRFNAADPRDGARYEHRYDDAGDHIGMGG
jgi:hypothetical protein